MAHIIAFFNQKGGTAKTTSTMNVAAALSERGQHVLMLDMDPQASLSMAVGVDVPHLEQSIYDVLVDESIGLDSIVEPTKMERISIAPSHPDLAAAELELLNVLERERQLERVISSNDLSAYDYVLIDSPPALNILSINILIGVDSLIIPIEPHPLALMVLRRLFETLDRIRRLNPELDVIGFLPTKVHHSSRLVADMIETLEEGFPTIPLLPTVPLSVKGAESIVEQTSILQYMPRSPLSTAYREVAGAIIAETRKRRSHAGQSA